MFSLLKHIISLNVEQSNAMKAIMLFLNLSLSWWIKQLDNFLTGLLLSQLQLDLH